MIKVVPHKCNAAIKHLEVALIKAAKKKAVKGEIEDINNAIRILKLTNKDV